MTVLCHCEFEPDPSDPDEDTIDKSWHFRRTCPHCLGVWWGLHCRHDAIQRGCPQCHEVSFWPPAARFDTLAIERAWRAWRHWWRAMERTWLVLPSLDFEVTYQNEMILIGGWFKCPVDAPLNDNQRPRP